jgi:hypothetical protein
MSLSGAVSGVGDWVDRLRRIVPGVLIFGFELSLSIRAQGSLTAQPAEALGFSPSLENPIA